MAEFYFYIVCIVILGGWLWYKGKTNRDQYMSQDWLDSCK